MTRLSAAQRRVLETLAAHPDAPWEQWLSWRKAGVRNIKTLFRLTGTGLIDDSYGRVRITPAGRAALKDGTE